MIASHLTREIVRRALLEFLRRYENFEGDKARACGGRRGRRGATLRPWALLRVGVQVGRAPAETAERAFGGKPSGATRRGVLSECSVMLCMAS